MGLLNLKPVHKMREYKCRFCRKLLLRYGSFHHEFPAYKELRAEKDMYKKEDMKAQQIFYAERPGKPIGLLVQCRCASCGQHNKFTVIFGVADEKLKIAG